MTGGVTVSYSGVHQAYQLALAAEEAGLLDAFHCSVFAHPGKWGGKLAQILGADALINRRVNGLPPEKVIEHPWPLLRHRLRAKWRPGSANDWIDANDAFDRRVARDLERSPSRVFVGVETCAERSLQTARRRGMKTVLECPGVDAEFLDEMAARAARELGLRASRAADTPAMRVRKERELALADLVLVCSEFQRRTMERQGIPAERFAIVPLWVDAEFWRPAPKVKRADGDPLRVLFAGKINLRKGVPYLVEAVRQCGARVTLTLIGTRDSELDPWLGSASDCADIRPPTSKAGLREQFHLHDVLVLPTLGDSFGFVALEAMACGLPVIVTDHCGAPVPDESWRIPVMDADALASRLQHYTLHSEAVEVDGMKAASFVMQHSSSAYRRAVNEVLQRVLRSANH
jgi:hypothetical protein